MIWATTELTGQIKCGDFNEKKKKKALLRAYG
jgi:hypothetical protein